MNICKMKRSTQIAIMTGVGSATVEKIASGTAPLTLSDSVAGSILEITVKGRSVVSAGSIISVGDNGLTVTTANSDNTLTTSAELTTALPLRGVSDTVRDVMQWDGVSGEVTKKCADLDLGLLTWGFDDTLQCFRSSGDLQFKIAPESICSKYTYRIRIDAANLNDKEYTLGANGRVYIKDTDYTDATAFKASLSGVHLIYELATPATTPLTDAEISAFRGLRTFDPTTSISVTDNPSITVTYMGKKTTRTAPKKRTSRKKKA